MTAAATAATPLRRSPLHDEHVALGAKLAEFGGWEMPISYPSGTIVEHQACRTVAVLFDVSHLGTVRVSGPGGFDALQAAFTNDLGRVGPGRAQYTHLLDASDASVVDDLIIWWVSEQRFDVMPNASNTTRVSRALERPLHQPDTEVIDVTGTRAVLALQGPQARELLATVCPDAADIGRFHVGPASIVGFDCVVAGTGYTGEDGVEIAVPVDGAVPVWRALTGAGAIPAGLGARDTLRLEAGLPLHGHELGAGITSDDAGLSWVVRPAKGDFIGRDALLASREGPRHRLHGIATEGRQPPRDGSTVLDADGRTIGRVSSGNFSPTLGHGIALAFLDGQLDVGTPVGVEVRGRVLSGHIASTPFVRPQSH